MGFLDRAKKLAEQAKEIAAQAKDKAEGALADAQSRPGPPSGSGPRPPTWTGPPSAPDPRMGTPYRPGMLGRPGWRERGLVDPAALLPIAERDRVGVPHSTKSQILEEPFGMGRRWSSGDRSAALFYQLYPEHLAWEPPTGKAPVTEVAVAGRAASAATLPDGRTLVFLGANDRSVVLEVTGIDDTERVALARTVAERLAPA